MNKIIIDNRTDLLDEDAIILASNTSKLGRIKNDGMIYVYPTFWKHNDKMYKVTAYLNKKSDRFVIMEDRR